MSTYGGLVKKAVPEEEAEGMLNIFRGEIPLMCTRLGFSGTTPTSNASKAAQNMRRAGTIVRSPLERREKKEAGDGEIRAAEVFADGLAPNLC